MRVDFFIKHFSTKKNNEDSIVWSGLWKEIWDYEISDWPSDYNIHFHPKSLNIDLKTMGEDSWVLCLQVKEGYYIMYRQAQEGDVESLVDDYKFYTDLKRCHEVEFKFYFNFNYQHDVGYILDAIIYNADQGCKVFTINHPRNKNI